MNMYDKIQALRNQLFSKKEEERFVTYLNIVRANEREIAKQLSQQREEHQRLLQLYKHFLRHHHIDYAVVEDPDTKEESLEVNGPDLETVAKELADRSNDLNTQIAEHQNFINKLVQEQAEIKEEIDAVEQAHYAAKENFAAEFKQKEMESTKEFVDTAHQQFVEHVGTDKVPNKEILAQTLQKPVTPELFNQLSPEARNTLSFAAKENSLMPRPTPSAGKREEDEYDFHYFNRHVPDTLHIALFQPIAVDVTVLKLMFVSMMLQEVTSNQTLQGMKNGFAIQEQSFIERLAGLQERQMHNKAQLEKHADAMQNAQNELSALLSGAQQNTPFKTKPTPFK